MLELEINQSDYQTAPVVRVDGQQISFGMSRDCIRAGTGIFNAPNRLGISYVEPSKGAEHVFTDQHTLMGIQGVFYGHGQFVSIRVDGQVVPFVVCEVGHPSDKDLIMMMKDLDQKRLTERVPGLAGIRVAPDGTYLFSESDLGYVHCNPAELKVRNLRGAQKVYICEAPERYISFSAADYRGVPIDGNLDTAPNPDESPHDTFADGQEVEIVESIDPLVRRLMARESVTEGTRLFVRGGPLVIPKLRVVN